MLVTRGACCDSQPLLLCSLSFVPDGWARVVSPDTPVSVKGSLAHTGWFKKGFHE